MPRRAREWSALDVKRAAHPDPPAGRWPAAFAVGGVAGLHLQVTPSGAKTWLLRVAVGARRREIGLGAYPEISLAGARERARDTRDAIRRGVDPVERRKAARAAVTAAQQRGLTFKDAVDRCLTAKMAEFGNAKHAKQWRATLDTYAIPFLGNLMVSDITVSDLQRALKPIWESKTETAAPLRGRIETVLAWSTVAGHRSGDNPARWKGNLDAILAKPGKVARVENHPALALDDAAPWFAALRLRDGMAARALEFAALTATRSGEVRGATWAEIDLDKALWTIPAARMKAGREHRVPLAGEVVALLQALPRFAGTDIVFPAARGGALSDMALSAVMRRMNETKAEADFEAGVAPDRAGWRDPRNGRPAVPHGLRSVFRDWCAERTDWPREMAEIALAHVVGSEVERSYRRGDMVERRRAMMADWRRFLHDVNRAHPSPFAETTPPVISALRCGRSFDTRRLDGDERNAFSAIETRSCAGAGSGSPAVARLGRALDGRQNLVASPERSSAQLDGLRQRPLPDAAPDGPPAYAKKMSSLHVAQQQALFLHVASPSTDCAPPEASMSWAVKNPCDSR